MTIATTTWNHSVAYSGVPFGDAVGGEGRGASFRVFSAGGSTAISFF
jgi:hypothetical protein